MRLSWARTIARVARPSVLTTCSFIVNAVQGTNVSAARFWLRDMSQLLNIVARASGIAGYFVGIAPFKCHDSHATLFRFMPDHGVRYSLKAMIYCDFIKTSPFLSFLASGISRKRMYVDTCMSFMITVALFCYVYNCYVNNYKVKFNVIYQIFDTPIFLINPVNK